MINIYSKEMSIVNGDIYDKNNTLLGSNVHAELNINAYDIYNSEVILDRSEEWSLKSYIIFKSGDDCELHLRFKKVVSRNSISNEVIFNITDKSTIQGEKRDRNIYLSGPVENIWYHHDLSIVSDDIRIECKEISEFINGDENKRYIFELSTNNLINYDDANLIFAMLSAITGAKFFCTVIYQKQGVIKLYRRYSKKCSLSKSIGLFYPIIFDDLTSLNKKINNYDFMFNFMINYTDFTTNERREHQLILGCNILDHIIELYEHSIGKIEPGKTKKLYSVIRSFFPNENTTISYLLSLIDGLPGTYAELSNKKKFEFYELRDQIVHRGMVFTSKNDTRKLDDNIFVVNEIIRILIPQLYKIGPVKLKNNLVYKVSKLEEAIDKRIELIDRKLKLKGEN